jgi:hypothetical protein
VVWSGISVSAYLGRLGRLGRFRQPGHLWRSGHALSRAVAPDALAWRASHVPSGRAAR